MTGHVPNLGQRNGIISLSEYFSVYSSVLQVFLAFLRVQVRWDSPTLCMSDDGENKKVNKTAKNNHKNMLKIERKSEERLRVNVARDPKCS